ncbi:spherulation-specific family 4 protein [Streptomyces polyrhachis]|uniref:Spherulation-specific family 4 protein n=1 Tax=Streptomyces polyrhachis TaxID=1282885 RepID=A0ABW2GIM2_9ACTN
MPDLRAGGAPALRPPRAPLAPPVPVQPPLGLGIPGYAHPLVAPLEWGELARAPRAVHWSVLNVAGSGGGPGSRPDPHCLQAAGALRCAGVRVLGQLDLRWGRRPFGELITEAHRYLEWYKVDGFYLERCPTERSLLQTVRRTSTTLGALSPGAHIVLAHGTHPYPGYAEAADQLVTFAGSWTDYRWSQVAEWTAEHPAERFVHQVHGVPRSHLEEAMRIARWHGAGTVYFTDRRSWEAMPGYWDEIVSRIGRQVSE